MAKVLISVDEALLARMDRAAKEAGLTRSAYLAGLAEADLSRASGPGRRPEVRAALDAIDDLFEATPTPGVDSTEAVRALRDTR